MENWSTVTHIWEGLENFRQLRRDIFRIGIKQVNQSVLDQFFTSYKFRIGFSAKNKMVDMITQTLDNASFKDPVLKANLEAQRDELQKVQEDLILSRTMPHYNYEYVFHEENNNLRGFVKIFNKMDYKHVGYLDWKDLNDLTLCLVELDNDHLRMHINYGEEGLAIVDEPSDLTMRWTHCLQEGYLDIIHAEYGSIVMSRMTKNVKLEHGNLAAVEAAKLAQLKQANDKTLIENNIDLMKMYKPELEILLAQAKPKT